jgi:hypothetical protein
MVGRVFFKAVASDLPDQDFAARLGYPPAGERLIHLCDIRIVELVEEIVGIAVEKTLKLIEQVWLRTAADVGQKIFPHSLVILELPRQHFKWTADGFIFALATNRSCAFAHRFDGEWPLADAERLIAARPIDEPDLDGSLLVQLDVGRFALVVDRTPLLELDLVP